MKLNLGCGSNKIDGFVNIDCELSCNPDLVLNFVKDDFPYDSESVEQVVMFHTIEHIQKRYHELILNRIHRILKKNGILYVSYPEFSICYNNWFENKQGRREFWEATIFGRQLYKSDHHVCIMHTPDFKETLQNCGYKDIKWAHEVNESFNTMLTCRKGDIVTYADWLNLENKKIVFR